MSDKSQRVRDPEGTRTSIIDTAERLFAENGFAATSMRDISTASGVSHPLIHHYFGSKDELYSAVKRRLVEGYAKRFPRAARAVERPLGVRPRCAGCVPSWATTRCSYASASAPGSTGTTRSGPASPISSTPCAAGSKSLRARD